MKRYKTFKNDDCNIERVIEQRLKLQSTQKILALKFNLNLNKLDKPQIKNVFKTLDINKQNQLIYILGGINFKKTKEFIEEIN